MDRSSRRGFLKSVTLAGAAVGLSAPDQKASAQDLWSEKLARDIPRRKLGRTGAKVPILNLGCAQSFDPTYDKLLHRAFAEGIDYFDTARVYAEGASHRGIANFLPQIGGRDKIWLTSKESAGRPSVAAYTAGLDRCIEELRVDHLDLYFMHQIDDLALLEPDYIRMGEALRKSGKTRFFGFSTHGDRVAELLEKAAKVGGIDAIMFRYSFARYGDLALNRAIDACIESGIGLIAMKTIESVPEKSEKAVGFSSKNFTLPQAKLKAVWADERISSICSHIDNTAKLAENVAAAKSPVRLSMHDIQELRRVDREYASLHCLGCSHFCEPEAGGGVRIADTLRYLMYSECYGEPERARTLYAELSDQERGSGSVDFARARSACPRGIDIPSRMALARHLLGDAAV
ncbi:MAG: hypothetical protein CME06_16710 [Gemmatimonadetes bacterium]|nr:hypothetical protein [Gemmatimonadota bacterium]